MFEYVYDKNYVPTAGEEVICRRDKVYNSEIAEELIKLGHKGFKNDDGVNIFKDWKTEKFDDDYEAVFSDWWDFEIKRWKKYCKEHPSPPMYGRGSKKK